MPAWFYIFTDLTHVKIAARNSREALSSAPEGRVTKVTYVNMLPRELESYWASFQEN